MDLNEQMVLRMHRLQKDNKINERDTHLVRRGHSNNNNFRCLIEFNTTIVELM